MVRDHLHQIEKTDFDTAQYRLAILRASGGIPSETIRLIHAMARADDPMDTIASWEISEKFPAALTDGGIGMALQAIDETSDEGDYEALDDLVHGVTGKDLVTIGPDLLATGLIAGWSPKSHRIRRSALGDLVVRELEPKDAP